MAEMRTLEPGAAVSRLSLVVPPGAFRLILALAVVVSHMSALDIGRVAVMLFFYLSGYWTSKIWKEKFGSGSTGRFYLARYWRIAPLFLLATMLSAWVRGQQLHLTNFTLLGLGLDARGNDPTIVSWSLDIELQFYLLVPLVVPLLASAPWRLMAASLIAAVGGWWLYVNFDILVCAKFLPVFFLGSLTYIRAWKPSALVAHASLAAFVLMTIVTAMTPFMTKGPLTPDPFDHDVWDMIWMLPLLPYVARSLGVRSTPLDRHFGNLSFPLYLAHTTVIFVVQAWLGHGAAGKLATLLIAMAVALTAYVLVDRPLDRIRVRVTEGVRAA
jgi:peptidoglycan/LPS O-acetylase OafA/YrhL